MNFIVICCLNCSPECNWRTKKQSFQSFLNFSALSVNSYEKSMLKSLTQQHSSRLSLNSNFIVQVRDFFVLLFFFDFGNDWFSASRSGKALLKRIFSFECFLFLGKGRRGCMLFTDTLLHPFRFPPYSSFFSNDKEIRGLAPP